MGLLLKPLACLGRGPGSPAGATLRISHSLESFGSGTPSSSSSSSREMTLGLGIGKSAPEKGGKKTPGLLQVCYAGFIQHCIKIICKGRRALCAQVSGWERKVLKSISSQRAVAAGQVTSLLASPVFRGGMCHPSTPLLCTHCLKTPPKLPSELHFLSPPCPPAKNHAPRCAERARHAEGRRPALRCWLCPTGTAFVLAAPAGCVWFWEGIMLWRGRPVRGGAGGGGARARTAALPSRIRDS